MPARPLRWRAYFPRRAAPLMTPQQKAVVQEADDEEDSVCRFCWQVQDTDHGGELLAPCRCTGSIRYVHRRCLGAWQRTQRSQGALRKSYKCDICKERYRVRRAPFSGAKFLGGRLPTMEEAKEMFFSFLGSPAWQVVMDVWKIVILANGVFRGLVKGFQGFETGARFGVDKLKWYISSVGTCFPIVILIGSLWNSLQLPALMLTVVSTAAISAQMLLAAIVGFYGGAMLGFAHGSWQIFRGTWSLTRTVCCSGLGAVALAFGGTFRKSFGIVNHIFPFVQHFFLNNIVSAAVSP